MPDRKFAKFAFLAGSSPRAGIKRRGAAAGGANSAEPVAVDRTVWAFNRGGNLDQCRNYGGTIEIKWKWQQVEQVCGLTLLSFFDYLNFKWTGWNKREVRVKSGGNGGRENVQAVLEIRPISFRFDWFSELVSTCASLFCSKTSNASH